MEKIQNIKNRRILIDSNIPIYYSSEGFRELSGDSLKLLVENGNKLYISPITGFEILQGENEENKRNKYLNFLNSFPTLNMEQGFFQNGAVLGREYRRICDNKKVPPLDLIIGGIVLAHSVKTSDKMLLLTCDRNDFCEPIWKTIAHQAVIGKDGRKVMVNIYLLECNTEIMENKNLPK